MTIAARIRIDTRPEDYPDRETYDDATYDELLQRAAELSPGRQPIRLEVEYRDPHRKLKWLRGDYPNWEKSGDAVEVTWDQETGEAMVITLPPYSEVAP